MRKIEEVATTVFKTVKPNKNIVVDYDKEEDVLYINFPKSPIQVADFARRFGDYIVRIKDGTVIGVTIINAKQHLRKSFADKPSILVEPITVTIA
jgi:uncharacterized protein YuzE